LGRGGGGASEEAESGFFSNAAILSRKEPGLGFDGGGVSDISRELLL
jgi:hypothetical protein